MTPGKDSVQLTSAIVFLALKVVLSVLWFVHVANNRIYVCGMHACARGFFGLAKTILEERILPPVLLHHRFL